MSCFRTNLLARSASKGESHPCLRCGLVIVLLLAGGSARAHAVAPLADAAEKKDRAKVAALLQKGTDVNASQSDGMTALHWAVYHDDGSLAKQLLKAGAHAEAANRYGVTPLSVACTNGNTEIVELLLKAGADANTTMRGGETALMTAARTGKPGPVRALLSRGAKVNARDRKGQTALMWAAAEGHAEVVSLLLAAKADFKTLLPSGFTPLLFAARAGHLEVVRVLLKAGADIHDAIPNKNRVPRGPKPGTGALLMAVENGHFELAIELVKAGADPNDQRAGYGALHMISWVRKPSRGDDEEGDPPPIGSGKLTSLEFVKEMVAHGADVNLPSKVGVTGRGILNKRGATPFLAAASTADVPLMELLVKLGADPLRANCAAHHSLAGRGRRRRRSTRGNARHRAGCVRSREAALEARRGRERGGWQRRNGDAWVCLPEPSPGGAAPRRQGGQGRGLEQVKQGRVDAVGDCRGPSARPQLPSVPGDRCRPGACAARPA